MILELLLQLALELSRALLVDAISGNVRRRVSRWFFQRGRGDYRRTLFGVHRRNRERLLNRLLTEVEDDP